MQKNKDNLSLRTLVILFLILCSVLLLLINIIMFKKEDNEAYGFPNLSITEEEEGIIKELQPLGEYDRIKIYLFEYLEHIENSEYEKSYNLLADKFKKKYFSTFEEYKNYVTNKYPQIITIDYTDVYRQGEYYVIKVEFIDILMLTGNEEEDAKNKFNQFFVIYEKDFNDFVLSFQAE